MTLITLTTTRDKARGNGQVQQRLSSLALTPEQIETRFDGRTTQVRVSATTDMPVDELMTALKQLFDTDEVEVRQSEDTPQRSRKATTASSKAERAE